MTEYETDTKYDVEADLSVEGVSIYVFSGEDEDAEEIPISWEELIADTIGNNDRDDLADLAQCFLAWAEELRLASFNQD